MPLKTKKQLSGWWTVLAFLPAGFIFQLAFTTTFNHIINGGMFQASIVTDGFILLRCIAGLLWQPRSPDWKWYLAFLPLSVLLFGFLGVLFGILNR